jgi:hypothetical protein
MPSLGDLSGNYIGAAVCEENYASNQPPVPYGVENANSDPRQLFEEGFKCARRLDLGPLPDIRNEWLCIDSWIVEGKYRDEYYCNESHCEAR